MKNNSKNITRLKRSDLPHLFREYKLSNTEIRLLTEYLLLDSLEKISISDKLLDNSEEIALHAILMKLSIETPISQIIGQKEFRNNIYFVTDQTLIPRIETERLVDITVDFIKLNYPGRKIRILEVGVGTGCISISIAKELDNLNMKYEILGIDISESALEIAERNRNKILGYESNIEFKRLTLDELIFDKFDIIISNPPYIPSKQIKYLPRSVKDHEPYLALDGGINGTDLIEQIINFSINNNINNIFLEIHSKNQFLKIRKQYRKEFQIKLEKDIFGRYRYLIIYR